MLQTRILLLDVVSSVFSTFQTSSVKQDSFSHSRVDIVLLIKTDFKSHLNLPTGKVNIWSFG